MSEDNKDISDGIPNGETRKLSDDYAFRLLNSFKEDVRIDGKGLSKEHGMNPSWWGSKKATMKRSPKVYDRLREMGFTDKQIAPWVIRPPSMRKKDALTAETDAPQAETDASTAETDAPQVETAETPRTQAPKGAMVTGLTETPPQWGASVFTPTHLDATLGASRRAYKGIPEHQL